MHILFLTDNFPPEVNAPASRTYEHCREWVKEGHKVTIVTCAPNFPKGVVFEGYRNCLRPQNDLIDGIHVVRVWSYIAANEGFVKRTLDFISFMFSAILISPTIKKVDLVIGTSPQFFTVCAAYIVGLIKRIPFVFELRDLYPTAIEAMGAVRNKKILKLLYYIELYLYDKASLIVPVTHSFKKNLIERGVQEEKIVVITNGVDLNRFYPMAKDIGLVEELELEDKFVVGYIGTMGLSQALETVLLAAKEFQILGLKDVLFILLGDGACKKELEEKAAKEGIENVRFISTVTKHEVTRYWSVLDASVIHLKRHEIFTAVIPSKLFESLAMGVPILHGVRGESAAIVEEMKAGLVFEPENHGQLYELILEMHNNPDLNEGMRNNCLKAAKKYNRKYKATQMLDYIKKVKR